MNNIKNEAYKNTGKRYVTSSVLKISFRVLLLLSVGFLSNACKIYSFTGTTLSSDLKTITIQTFVMNTAGGPANLTLTFTEKLKEYYQRNTSLKLKPTNGDLYLEGAITGYELTPVAATASDKAALNRLTIRVEVRFVNSQNEDESFEKEFSFYKDFPQDQTLTQVEGSLVPQILDQLVLDIFNNTAAQW
ncbi:LptE family protein [Emticicia sp. 17c]|uniref:LptE family protein n=1 Tax=Emticicia sp. 17c TaxID=3127704 RepID=UPI00301C1CE2